MSGAAAPDGGAWFATLAFESASVLLRSDDQGLNWSMVGGEPARDRLLGAVGLDDGSAVAWSAERAWRWRDGAWSAEDLPAPMTVAAGGSTLTMGGEAGLWEGEPLARVLDVPILAVSDGVAVDTEGGLWADGASLDAPVPMTAAAWVDGTLYAGDADGRVWRLGEAWSRCGPLPVEDEVVRLAGGDVLLVATATRAPFVSEDGCATWEDVHAPLDTSYDQHGDAETAVEAFSAMVAGDRWLVAGWEGLATSDDGGLTWSDPPLVPPDYNRALVFDGGRLYVGTYAAGVILTEDGGRTFSGKNDGLSDPNVQRLAMGPDGALWAVADHHLWRSDDRARSWTLVDEPFSIVTSVFPDEATYLFGGRTQDEGAAVAVSEDGGSSWRRVDLLLGSEPRGMARVGRSLCIAGVKPVRVRCGEGDTWATVYEVDGEEVAGPVDAGGRVVWADASGVRDADGLLAELSPADPVRALAADGERVWAATRSAEVWQSEDGGRTWTKAAERLAAPIYILAPVPSGGALAGTHDGIFLVEGGTAERWAGYARIDDRSPYLACAGCPSSYGRGDASLSTMRPLEAGDTIVLEARATSFRVVGDGDVRVRVDGVEAPLGCGGETEAFDDAWHLVEIEGEGAMVDYVEALRPGTSFETGCGARAWMVPIGVFALVRRRRGPACYRA